MPEQVYAERVLDIGFRPATSLGNETTKIIVADQGGMVPELSYRGNNSHWTPQFRSNSGIPYDAKLHANFWKINLLYHVAGNFPCIPTFGASEGHEPHGAGANKEWKFKGKGVIETANAAYSVSTMEDSSTGTHLTYTKYDIVFGGSPTHYTVLRIKNNDHQKDVKINVAWHNTVGSPFLQPGNLIDLCASHYSVPEGFEPTQLFRGSSSSRYSSLERLPTVDGAIVNARLVRPLDGHTDFIGGAISNGLHIGWGSVLNPMQQLVYLSFFKGGAAAREKDIILQFNDLWLQNGGRPSTPWASQEGSTDITYCLGQENAVGFNANGLAASLKTPTFMGNPTTVEIKAQKEKTLQYGTIFTDTQGKLERGVQRVVRDARGIDVIERETGRYLTVPGDATFANLDALLPIINEQIK